MAPHRWTRALLGRATGAALACGLLLGLPGISVGVDTAAAGASTTASDTAAVVVVVGDGRAGSGGVGGPATAASLSGPTGIALDPAGNLFVADTGNCRVVEVPARTAARTATRPGSTRPAGHLVVVAGDGCQGPVRPGAPATRSGVGFAEGVAVDGSGDLFVADTSGNQLLMVAGSTGTRFGRTVTAGRLVVLAGTGAPGALGDGGPAPDARLDAPQGVAVDAAGDVFVADTANCRVREIPATSGAGPWAGPMVAGDIYTVAGTGRCGSPAGAGSDGDGGPALQAVVWGPTAVAVDPAGDLLIADRGDDEVREVSAHGGTSFGVPIAAGHIATVAGTGAGYGPYLADGLSATGATASLNFPEGLALDRSGDLVVADADDRAVREVGAGPAGAVGAAPVGDMTTVIGALLAGPDQEGTHWVRGTVEDPWGVAVGPGGAVYFSDRAADVVRMVTPGT